jgi:hypothetical protein
MNTYMGSSTVQRAIGYVRSQTGIRDSEKQECRHDHMIYTLWTTFHGRFYARNSFIHLLRHDGTTIDDMYTS